MAQLCTTLNRLRQTKIPRRCSPFHTGVGTGTYAPPAVQEPSTAETFKGAKGIGWHEESLSSYLKNELEHTLRKVGFAKRLRWTLSPNTFPDRVRCLWQALLGHLSLESCSECTRFWTRLPRHLVVEDTAKVHSIGKHLAQRLKHASCIVKQLCSMLVTDIWTHHLFSIRNILKPSRFGS